MAHPLSRLALAILLAGFIVGGWRAWSPRGHIDELAVNSGVTTVILVASQSKSIWIQHQVTEFNSRHDKARIEVKFVEDRDAMTSILYGRQIPDLWCPDSPLWIDRINDLWRSRHSEGFVDEANPTSFRVLMRSPLVFLTTADKAAFLRPLLGSEHPWSTIGKLTTGTIRPPWGRFRLAVADPLQSNGGILTLAMSANEYARGSGNAQVSEGLVDSPGFVSYLHEIASSARTYPGIFELTRAYAADPSIVDVIVTQESAAFDAVRHDRRLVAIYPEPTLETADTVCVVSVPRSSARRKALALEFATFLGRPEAAGDVVAYDMRPPAGLDEAAIDRKLSGYRVSGLGAMYTTGTVPPYGALNALVYQWAHCARE